MQIAILHYHLNPGGVTQVIANHLQSLDLALEGTSKCKVAIFHGGKIEGWNAPFLNQLQHLEVSIQSLPALSYDTGPAECPDPAGLAKELLSQFARIGFDSARTVIHVHNHSLGKNISLSAALHQLAVAGYPLLLQVHDFSEDFRPDQYARVAKSFPNGQAVSSGGLLYPQASQIHYAVLNSRDRDALSRSGVADQRLHELPNPIVEFNQLPPRDKIRTVLSRDAEIPVDKPLLVYPVRCIRRKNIGELLLWATLLQTRACFAATLAPQNAMEIPAYDRWKRLAKEAQLPCLFELGDQLSFRESLAASDALITTSVAEGFGMVFLESQLMGRNLLGRKLPEITKDFEKNQINFSSLYERFSVPVDLIGLDQVRRDILAAYQKTIAAYDRRSITLDTAGDSFDRLVADGTIDFAMLTPEMQSVLILQLSSSFKHHEILFSQNPRVAESLSAIAESHALLKNARAVRDHYHPQICGRRLWIIYQSLLESEREIVLSNLERYDELLDFFLKIERFRPIRSMS